MKQQHTHQTKFVAGTLMAMAGVAFAIEPVATASNQALVAARAGLIGAQPADPAPAAAPAPPPPPDPTSFWEGWKRTAELGMSGSNGNTENFSLRAMFSAERKTSLMETRGDIGYFYATDDSEKSKSRGEANLRNDWLFADSPWGFFAQGRLEYDEFQDWQWRASGFLGPSYTFIKNDTTLLRGRAGLGGAYEWGKQAEEEFDLEAILAIDVEHKFSERTKGFITIEYYPSLDDFPDYRLYGKAGLEVIVDPELNMSFKIGAVDRYDASPGEGRRRNDLEYFAALAWTF